MRTPGFCAGCPHNRSTRVPEGSRALAGIGCHTMAMLVNPQQTTTASHMGGEGAMWLGQQPFTTQQHVFANLGDGTYAHSGSLAIRQAVAANVPITYKILYNGFVSMTGGQPIEGGMTPAQILAELAAEGVKKWRSSPTIPTAISASPLPPGVSLRHRDAMDETQREFREYQGRLGHPLRPALRDRAPAPAQARQMGRSGHPHLHQPAGLRRLRRLRTRLQLHGDRAAGDRIRPQAPHQPVELQQGFFLRRGFLPELRHRSRRKLAQARGAAPRRHLPPVPEPALPEIGERYNVLVAGIGGSGVVTISQTLAVAAYLDGLFSSNLDLTGLSQKYGAVTAHVRMARDAGRAACDPHRRGRSRRADRLRPHRRRGRRMPRQARSRHRAR